MSTNEIENYIEKIIDKSSYEALFNCRRDYCYNSIAKNSLLIEESKGKAEKKQTITR
jgi:hypothetical protein